MKAFLTEVLKGFKTHLKILKHVLGFYWQFQTVPWNILVQPEEVFLVDALCQDIFRDLIQVSNVAVERFKLTQNKCLIKVRSHRAYYAAYISYLDVGPSGDSNPGPQNGCADEFIEPRMVAHRMALVT